MSDAVTIRDLRNKSAEVLARVAQGESLTVTKDGAPVARVVPLPRTRLRTAEVQRRLADVPAVDYAALRRDIDRVIDPTLTITGEDR